MVPGRREAIIGSLTGLALAFVLLGTGLLLSPAFPPAVYASLIGLPGLLVGPIVGWRHGPSASRPGAAWTSRAVRESAVVAFVAYLAYGLFVLLQGAPGGPGSEVGFLAYVLLWSGFVAILTAVAVLPLGWAWWQVVRRLTAPGHPVPEAELRP